MAVQSETASNALTLAPSERKQRTLWGDVWQRFRRHRLAMFGLVVFVVLILGFAIGPLIYTVDPETIDIIDSSQPPSVEHPFGTDDLGRDLLARNMYGGRISLSVGVVAMLVAMTFGTLIGILAGFFSKLDGPLMRFTDMMLALPQLPLLLVIIMLFRDSLRKWLGPELGIFLLVVVVIGILGWMPTSRVVRGSVLSVKEKEFVEASVSVGSRQRRLVEPPRLSQRAQPHHRLGHAGHCRGHHHRVRTLLPGSGLPL